MLGGDGDFQFAGQSFQQNQSGLVRHLVSDNKMEKKWLRKTPGIKLCLYLHVVTTIYALSTVVTELIWA